MTDQELIQEILKGNQSAVSLFYRRYQPKLQAYIAHKINERSVEEVLQDTFISALQSLALFAGKSTLESWLFSIARHEVCDYYRKQKIKEIVFSKVPFLAKLISAALSPEMAYEEVELKEKVKNTLGKLNEGKRRLLRLRYIDGRSVKEVAGLLAVSYKAAESKLSRARLAFQKEFVGQNQKHYQSKSFTGSA